MTILLDMLLIHRKYIKLLPNDKNLIYQNYHNIKYNVKRLKLNCTNISNEKLNAVKFAAPVNAPFELELLELEL